METDTQEHEYGPPLLVVACISWEEQRTWSGCNLECFIGDMTISKPHHGTSYSNSLFNRFDVSSASPSSSYKLSLRSLNRLSWAGWEEEDGAAVVVTGEQYPGFYDSGGPATTRTGKLERKRRQRWDVTHGRWVSWSDWETSDAEEEQKINKLHP